MNTHTNTGSTTKNVPATPADVLGNVINTDNFSKTEEARHKCEKTYWSTQIQHIDLIKFGDYFYKCIGNLNSIMKKADVKDGDTKQFVVKNSIGVRRVDRNGVPQGNAKYATHNSVFKFLHERHIPLICKKEKRRMVSDFYAIKDRAINEYKNILKSAYNFIPDNILIADAYTLHQKRPSHYGVGTRIGYIITNERVIPKSNIKLDINFGSIYKDYDDVIDHHRNIYYSKNYYKRYINLLRINCNVEEPNPNENTTESNFGDSIQLFSSELRTSTNALAHNFNIFDTKFDGFDITELIDFIVFEIDKLHSKFDDDLEQIKEKYISEYLLSELCDSKDSAI
jgi:hypothetical protein